jgi:hypothetical protein
MMKYSRKNYMIPLRRYIGLVLSSFVLFAKGFGFFFLWNIIYTKPHTTTLVGYMGLKVLFFNEKKGSMMLQHNPFLCKVHVSWKSFYLGCFHF